MKEFVIGLDIGGTLIKGGLFTYTGDSVKNLSVETQVHSGQAQVLKNLSFLVTALCENKDSIAAVGVGIAGVLDPKREILLQSPNLPELNNLALKHVLSEMLMLPVFIENDANAAALGEQWVGAGKGIDNFLLITLGTGIGGGLMLHGELCTGETGKAGEFGHMVVEADGMLCACGKRGCLEAYSSGEAIKRMAQESIQSSAFSSLKNLSSGDYASITSEMVYYAAANGDAIALEAFRKAGRYLAIGIANINNFLDINTFIIGGGVSKAFDVVAPFVREEARKQVFDSARDKLVIIASQLGSDAGTFGAGHLALKGVK